MQSDGSGHGDSPDGVPIPTGATVLLRSGSEIDPLAFAGSWRFERPNLLGVTIDRSIQLFLADWRASVERTPRDVGLVGVGETTRSAVGRQSADDRDGGYAIRTVADPTDLDAVEGHVASLLDGWRTRPEPTVVVVDSVTGLLDVVPERDAVGFLDDLADLVANGGAVGLLVARSTAAERPLDAVTRPCVDEIEATPDGWRLVESGRPGERPALSAGEVFALLSDGRRRRVLQFLEDRERATVEDLADAIADGTGPYERSWLAGSLVHVHLPRLSDADVVDYDADAGVVEATGAVEHLLSMVELVDSRERE